MSAINPEQTTRRFKIALSYPREYQEQVSKIATRLAEKYSKEEILYDGFHEEEFARPNLDIHLQDLYRTQSDLIVVFKCKEYSKPWCGLEWRAIRSLMNQIHDDNRFMLIKCGEGDVSGIFCTVDGYLDLEKLGVDRVSEYIIKRYETVFGRNTTKTKGKAIKYNILLLDDNMEQLEILKGELERISDNECPYELRVTTVTKSTDVIEESKSNKIDVYVLDLTRTATQPWQTGKYDLYGLDLLRLLLQEMPHSFSDSVFYIYSKLPEGTVIHELAYPNVKFYRKQDTSPAQLAHEIKNYVDLRNYQAFGHL